MQDKVKKVFISACVVVYEEEENIKGMLESIKDFVDEIILVYDGEVCNDKTLIISENFCKREKIILKIFKRPHTGNPESHRPFSFEQASGLWILWIDADERLSGDKNGLKNFLRGCKDVARIRFLIGADAELKNPRYGKRRPSLLKRDSLYYFGVLGEKPGLLSGESYDYLGSVKIIHLIGERPFLTMLKRAMKYAKLRAEDMFTPIGKLPKFNLVDNQGIIDKFEKNRSKRRRLAIFYLMISPMIGMWRFIKEGRSLKATIASGVYILLYYLFIIIRSFNLIKND